ncbi:MAG: HAMP domain-containing histidine kinase [Gammaproteobacteria bacterium]|nr:HAMP domain-containing histidine kinase [Gammaproteobacteria bacterium]
MGKQSLFETVLASTVHDMKNSLSLLMGQLDNLSLRLEVGSENQQAVSSIRYESSRINQSLMQLLTLYKLENNQLFIQISEVEVVDFIEDCIATHSLLAENNGIQLEVDCDDSIIWFFDQDMVGIAIKNILGNSIRYTGKQVIVSVKVVEGHLVIQIDDDGPGYPENMIENPDQFIKKVNYSTGSTGLGLFFSATIAHNHHRSDRQGSIHLSNDGLLNGGSFQITLP